jgi:hypothetical protein
MIDDYKNYNGSSPTDNMKSREQDSYNSYVKALKDEFKKQKPDFVKTSLESEFDGTVNNIHFDIISDGRSSKHDSLTIKEGFELTNFVRKAGRKILINLPGLAGSQLQIRKEERNRKYDIDVRYPKTYRWTINFKIPDGYAAQGVNEINKVVDNETGGFSLTAKEEDGFVVISVLKTYKQKKIPSEKWDSMLNFIDAAYNSSFKYILLTPKQ